MAVTAGGAANNKSGGRRRAGERFLALVLTWCVVVLVLLCGTEPAWGSQVPDVVTMSSVSNITENSASIWGWIVDDGGSEIIDRRFDWGTSLPPSNAVYSSSISVAGNFLWVNLTGLSPNTTYYFRAWAKNCSTSNYPGLPAGWSHGQIQSFITAPLAPPLPSPPSPPRPTAPGWSSAPGPVLDALFPTFRWEAVAYGLPPTRFTGTQTSRGRRSPWAAVCWSTVESIGGTCRLGTVPGGARSQVCCTSRSGPFAFNSMAPYG